MSLTVNFSGIRHSWLLPLSCREIEGVLNAMYAFLDAGSTEVDVVLVRDDVMAHLNAGQMGCSGPTNILSFPLWEDRLVPIPDGRAVSSEFALMTQSGENVLGSLVLSVDTFRREALLYGQEPAAYCTHLFAHGLGHLAGYEHGPAMEALCAGLELAAGTWLTEACSG